MNRSLEALANQELLAATHELVRRDCVVEAELLRHLGEVDARRLYLEEACSSMIVYCVRRVASPLPSGNAAASTGSERVDVPVLNADQTGEAGPGPELGGRRDLPRRFGGTAWWRCSRMPS